MIFERSISWGLSLALAACAAREAARPRGCRLLGYLRPARISLGHPASLWQWRHQNTCPRDDRTRTPRTPSRTPSLVAAPGGARGCRRSTAQPSEATAAPGSGSAAWADLCRELKTTRVSQRFAVSACSACSPAVVASPSHSAISSIVDSGALRLSDGLGQGQRAALL